MNIGVIVYSWSGNTLSVAEKIKERLAVAGHSVTLEPVMVAGERKQGDRTFTLEKMPDVAPYDAVVFGSSVEAFSLSPVMNAYMKEIGSLEGKTIACLVTQAFPYRWMGGNHALRQMRRRCLAKDGTVSATGVVNWAKSRRAKTMRVAIDRLSSVF